MALHIVLIEPEIHTNTGNIGRLALATGCNLHLVKPYGFEISDKRLKRAGLDYWQHLNIREYENQKEFFESHKEEKMLFFSSHGSKNHWDATYTENTFLLFGKESSGLSNDILERNTRNVFKIPLYSTHVRSLNLANAVAITVYEGLRQLH
ncbi:tRNA (cytidine(34)-2'-O)-methyltransferase [Maribacter sp. 4G9]|uniref:tRNA (cytidine(34)-2'-O)-methyltransferase n=1 Tax=Maribacter sp. 4G9 TaxID=1889777 RepID=UPI000C1518B5|nr:tRNA (cytidine(34)-2'-O)-methyltransferase [Maribacter sp. 4G9]PIB29765.1 tRNA (uridine(34)/cytosine(34)/5-carboxymethylaminomethyluridine(34)-2'-O)-methyltransferase TrmL [Maribacter sp. 4G9]